MKLTSSKITEKTGYLNKLVLFSLEDVYGSTSSFSVVYMFILLVKHAFVIVRGVSPTFCIFFIQKRHSNFLYFCDILDNFSCYFLHNMYSSLCLLNILYGNINIS